MSVSCVNCGQIYERNNFGNPYCTKCGEKLPKVFDSNHGPVYPSFTVAKPTTREIYSKYIGVPIRNPLTWVLASILIPFFIYFYAYRNFQDMKDLNKKFHQSGESIQDPGLMLLFFIIFPPITIYFKFELFYNHLKNIHYEDPHFPDGTGIILHTLGGILVIFFIWLAVVYVELLSIFVASALVTIAFGIHLSYYHYHWQKEFNRHILRHRQAIES